LSPTLFNIFINDIVKYVDEGDSPIIEGSKGVNIPCLLYADDLALLSHSKTGLQKKLDRLNDFCQDWGMKINTDKTKVVVFAKKVPKVAIYFTCGEHTIESVAQYKYLGVIFQNNGHFDEARSHLAKQAYKAAHTLKRAFCKQAINSSIVTKLFDSLVTPILTYGAEVWFTSSFNYKGHCPESKLTNLFSTCLTNKYDHEKIHLRFCRQILGVHRKSTILPVLAELGRFPITFNIITQTISFWLHIIGSDSNSYKKLIYQSTNYVNQSPQNDFVQQTLETLDLRHVWQNQGTFSVNKLKHVVLEKLKNYYTKFWQSRKYSTSKLKFYDSVTKNINYKQATYLDKNIPFKHRQALAKLRISAHDLAIERGRYENIREENRLCNTCQTVENEVHFLNDCIKHTLHRKTLLAKVLSIDNNYTSVTFKPSELMSIDCFQVAIAQYVFKCL